MKRKFEIKIRTEIDLDSCDSLDTVKTACMLKEDFHYPTHSDVYEMVVIEIAKFIASELGEELGSNVECHLRGDNGDDDIGYELKNADGILCDIGITKIDGTWSVFIENGDQNREVTSIDDIVNYLEGR